MCKGEKSSELPKLQRPPGCPGTARCLRPGHGGGRGWAALGSWGTLSESGTGNASRFNQMCSPHPLKWERDLRVSLL